MFLILFEVSSKSYLTGCFTPSTTVSKSVQQKHPREKGKEKKKFGVTAIVGKEGKYLKIPLNSTR